MQCNELEQILEQHSDGPLPELANSHMNGCEACRALAADLEAIHTVAAGLGAEEIAPPEHHEASVMPSAENVFKEELLTVSNRNTAGFPARDAAVSDSIRRNLNIVDNFIAMCEKNVREQPENEMAREYLYGAYEQKAELLATAMDRSTMGGLQ